MVVITVELVPPRLRGSLTRWLTEVATGVYVGRINARVRDLLWGAVIEAAGTDGRALMVFRTNSEQGYEIVMHGHTRRKVVNVDGLQLVAVKHASWLDWVDDELDYLEEP